MIRPTVFILPTGAANLASVAAAVRRCDLPPRCVESREEILAADRLILPGVGTFGAAMRRLRSKGLVDALRHRLLSARPTLAICLGLHLLAQTSDESPGDEALGLLAAHIERFPAHVRVPHVGWNRVAPAADDPWLETGHAYFANSFGLTRPPGGGWKTAWAHHGVPFVAALSRGEVLACQFHPELSGAWGQRLLERWLRRGVR